MKTKRIHFLQHVDFEGPSGLLATAEALGCHCTVTKFYEPDWKLPTQYEYELLVVLGGPMGAYEEEVYPFLKTEKSFLREAIFSGKKVLGICLGAQLIASALGAKVYPAAQKEIGWYPIELKPLGMSVFNHFPEKVMHWHGDTFDLPEGAVRLASSPACVNQAFSYMRNVLALQFHLELTADSIARLIQEGLPEPAEYVSTEADIMEQMHYTAACEAAMSDLLKSYFKMGTDTPNSQLI